LKILDHNSSLPTLSGDLHESPVFVVSLAAALFALSASAQLAQQVPSAPGLAETDPSVKSSSSAPQDSQPQQAASQQRKQAPAKCNKAKNGAMQRASGGTQ
jgi:hypothetical protein